MTRRPRHPQPDANQAEIVRAVQRCGMLVLDVSAWFPVGDILVWGHDDGVGVHVWRLFELKTAAGKLTTEQCEFMVRYPGAVTVALSVFDVLRAFGRYRE